MKTKKSSRDGEESDDGGIVGRGITVLELGALAHTASTHTESFLGAGREGEFAHFNNVGADPSLLCHRSINPLEVHKLTNTISDDSCYLVISFYVV